MKKDPHIEYFHISWKILDADNRGIGPLRGPGASEARRYLINIHDMNQTPYFRGNIYNRIRYNTYADV